MSKDLGEEHNTNTVAWVRDTQTSRGTSEYTYPMRNDKDEPMDILTTSHLSRIQQSICEAWERVRVTTNCSELEFSDDCKSHFIERQRILGQVSRFWAQCLRHHPRLNFSTLDKDCISNYLKEFYVETGESSPSTWQSLVFNFDENPHFENKTCKKLIIFGDDGSSRVTSSLMKLKIDGPYFKDLGKAGNMHQSQRDMGIMEYIATCGRDTPEWITEILLKDIWIDPMQYYHPSISQYNVDDAAVVEEVCTAASDMPTANLKRPSDCDSERPTKHFYGDSKIDDEISLHLERENETDIEEMPDRDSFAKDQKLSGSLISDNHEKIFVLNYQK